MQKRVIIGFIILFLIVVALGGFIGSVLYSFYDNQISVVEKTEVIEEIEEIEEKKDIILPELPEIEAMENNNLVKEDFIYKEEQLKDEIINIVLAGVDARSYDTKSRSDTILLLSYNKEAYRLYILQTLLPLKLLPSDSFLRLKNFRLPLRLQ